MFLLQAISMFMFLFYMVKWDMQPIFHINIDGPVASGKGTIAKELGRQLGIGVLDTGALYRGTAWFMLDQKIDTSNEVACLCAMDNMNMVVVVEDGVTKVWVNGVDITNKIRTEEISRHSSIVSYASVRARLTDIIRDVATKQSLVVDGRDISLRVLPDAKYRFYLTAKRGVRAKRRSEQTGGCPKQIKRDLRVRDRRDNKRSPRPKGVVVIDNSRLDLGATIDKFMEYIRR